MIVVAFAAVATTGWLAGCRTKDPGAIAWAGVTPRANPGDSARMFDVVIRGESGAELRCLLRQPAREGRMPAVFIAGGMRTGRDAARIVGDAFDGIAFACDWPWRNPGDYSVPGLILRLPSIRSDIVSSPAFHRLAANWLRGRAEVDSTRFAAVGVSLGVPTVAAWAARDRGVTAVALLYGGARLDVLLDHTQRRNIGSDAIRKPLARLVARALMPLEPERTAPALAPRPVLVVIAVDDRRVPREAGEALATAAGPEATVRRVPGEHVSRDATELLRMLTDTTAAWLARVWSEGAAKRSGCLVARCEPDRHNR